MQPLKAHVRNGYFVSDEPTDLPEGTEASLVVADALAADAFADMDPDERAELHDAIEEGFRDLENGEHEDGLAFAERLAASQKPIQS
jgi:hypothetical protein